MPHDPVGRVSRGFTLVELLVATVIVGVLASIAVPSFRAARDKTFIEVARSDLRNLQHAVEAYASIEYALPRSIDELVSGAYVTLSTGVEVCLFRGIPPAPWRVASVIIMVAHRGSAVTLYTVYPLQEGRVFEIQTSRPGC